MAIVNRDLDSSQQSAVLSGNVANTASGSTYSLCVVPYPAQLLSAMQVTTGLSGSPNHSLWVQRWAGGVTSVVIGASMVSTAFATSGSQTFTIVNSGLSFLLQAGDAILLATAASNTGTVQTTVSLAIKALQDIKTSYGV